MDETFVARRRYLGGDKPGFPDFATGQKLLWVLLFSRMRYRVVSLLLIVVTTFFGLLAPYYQREFINGMQLSSSAKMLGRLLFLAVLFGILAQTINLGVRILLSREGAIGQRWLSRQLYNHALMLRSSARNVKTVGETVAHYATDVQTATAVLDDFLIGFLMAMGPLIGAPIALGLFYKIPVTSVSLVTLASVAVCLVFSMRQARFFTRFKRLAEERLSIVNEWLQNIRILRVLGWIEHFESRIRNKREEETQNRLSMVTNGSIMNAIAQAAPLVINAVGVFALIKHANRELTPGDIFGVLWVLGVFLNRPTRMIPWTIVVLLDALTSIRRLEKYFVLDTEAQIDTQETTSVKNAALLTSAPLSVRSLFLKGREQVLLDNVNFDVLQGEFIAIVGEVGSGKTLLLNSLLRDTDATFRQYAVGQFDALSLPLQTLRSFFAYVPQDGFIMSASVRENILFEYDASKLHDEQVLEALRLAQFSLSAENLAEGLDTEIGERGVNLSGGQRQRIALARAYLSNRPIVLLDDCLSALDVRTEEALVSELLCGEWKNKTRILVTHRLSVLKYVDRVFVMEKGRLRAQ